MTDIASLTRDQIARIVGGDDRAIRAFEELLEVAGEVQSLTVRITENEASISTTQSEVEAAETDIASLEARAVIPGGLANQVLAKVDGDDYNYQWVTVSGVGVSWGGITGTLADQTDLSASLNSKLEDAPSDGSKYVRQNGAWVVA